MTTITMRREGFLFHDVARPARYSDDPTFVAYDEETFFAKLDAGELAGCEFCQVQYYTPQTMRNYAFIVSPIGFRIVDEAVAAVQHRVVGRFAGADKIGLVEWPAKSADHTQRVRRERGVTGGYGAR